MADVPAGEFQRDDNFYSISVISSPYRMSAREITRTQFAALLTTDPSKVYLVDVKSSPVQQVNWYHAIAFANKLSIAEGLTPVYAIEGIDFTTLSFDAIPTRNDAVWDAVAATLTNDGYRLPTEMEWMWAAMGAPADGQNGGTNRTGYLKSYSGSAEGAAHALIGDYAWYKDNSDPLSAASVVGTKEKNELGLYDMSGNIAEWCWDWYGTYPAGRTLYDYAGPSSGNLRIYRGGHWYNTSDYCTVAYRAKTAPSDQSMGIGFRVVRK